MDKAQIRKLMLEKLKEQKKLDQEKKSGIIKDKLFGLEEFRKAKTVMFYVSLDYEVDTRKMIKETLRMGKVVVVPATVKKDRTIIPSRILNFDGELSPSNFGILEPRQQCLRPVPKEDLDLIIVPGLAFDESGTRIGHGGGYYDRFLKKLSPHTKTIGLAFSFQVFDRLPTGCHDVPVSRVISNEDAIYGT
jgi:5-formyltetrahydrofolate cyclo-ligase